MKKLIASVTVLSMIFATMIPAIAYASLDTDQRSLFRTSGITFWCPNSNAAGSLATNLNVNVTGGNAAEKVWNGLISAGFTPEQAAGIMGNLESESRFNPAGLGDNGTSSGIAQWHDSGNSKRQTNLLNYISANAPNLLAYVTGPDYQGLSNGNAFIEAAGDQVADALYAVQIQYIAEAPDWNIGRFQEGTSVDEFTWLFLTQFERPKGITSSTSFEDAKSARSERFAQAQKYYEMFMGSGGNTSTAGNSSGIIGGNTGYGDSDSCISNPIPTDANTGTGNIRGSSDGGGGGNDSTSGGDTGGGSDNNSAGGGGAGGQGNNTGSSAGGSTSNGSDWGGWGEVGETTGGSNFDGGEYGGYVNTTVCASQNINPSSLRIVNIGGRRYTFPLPGKSGGRHNHGNKDAVDLYADPCYPVVAITDGTVQTNNVEYVFTKCEGKKGARDQFAIVIGDGTSFFYTHLAPGSAKSLLKHGQSVEVGQLLGYVGEASSAGTPYRDSVGNPVCPGSSPHLHISYAPSGVGWDSQFGTRRMSELLLQL